MPTYPFSRAKPAGWAFGEVLTSAQMNAVDANAAQAADGELWTDTLPARNWIHKEELANMTVIGAGQTSSSITDTRWMAFGTSDGYRLSEDGGLGWNSGTIAALAATPLCFLANGTTILVGGDPGGSSAQKIARSTTGMQTGGFAAVNSVDSGTAAVVCLARFNSLYIAGLSDGGIETSSDGSTWADQTVPNANARREFATNGSILLCVSSASTDKYITSTNGTAWTERELPASVTGSRVVYCSGLSKFFVIGGNSTPNLFASTDGITWAGVTMVNGPAAANSYLITYGRVLVAFSGTIIYVSVDGGLNWRRGGFVPTGFLVTGSSTATYSGGRIVLLDEDSFAWISLQFT